MRERILFPLPAARTTARAAERSLNFHPAASLVRELASGFRV
jgi:hypothetical protein